MASEQHQLCASCSSIFFLLNSTERIKRDNVTLLVDSCRLCACVWDFRQSTRDLIPHSLESYYWLNSSDSDRCVFSVRHQIERTDHVASFQLVPLEDSNALHLPQPGQSSQTLSLSALSFLKAKFKRCVETHQSCRSKDEACHNYKPTRLLNLHGRVQNEIYLETTNESTVGPYFTLSHCWGDVQPIKLTNESEQALQASISIHSLPKTFKEAVELCWLFDVQYLWIDSLCIIQDDRTDWHSEAASMSHVYESALCNIAATGARNSSSGLSFDYQVDGATPFEILAPKRFWEAGEKQPEIRYLAYPRSSYLRNVEYSPLNIRAWVMQERLLSPRILHFAASGVYWECRTETSSDLYPDGLPNWMDQALAKQQAKMLLLKQNGKDVSQTPASWSYQQYNAWNMFCEAYSRLHMTMEDDKLVAIHGIAERTSQSNGDKLVCGLWEKKLLAQLLWVPRPLMYHSDPYPSRWRAPSWSWASHKRPIVHTTNFDHSDGEPKATVEKIDVDAYSSGQLKSASLTLRGKIVEATLETDNRSFDRLKTTAHLRSGDKAMRIQGPLLDAYFEDLVLFYGQVLCLSVWVKSCQTVNLEHSTFIKQPWELGILILKQCAVEPPTFRRIGLFLLTQRDREKYMALESSEEYSVSIV